MCSHSVDLDLVHAWTANIRAAIVAGSIEHAEALLDHLNSLLGKDVVQGQEVLRLRYSLGLDRGIARQYSPNEDFAFAHQWSVLSSRGWLPCGLFLVADGMGGHDAGEEASRLLVQTLVDFLMPATRLASFTGSPDELQALLSEGIQHGNQMIYQQNIASNRNMGTTVTALFLAGPVAVIANVGDSRTYLMPVEKPLKQLTTDHSVVAGMLARGEITEEQACCHPQKHMIDRALGQAAEVQVDMFVHWLSNGDRFLLCSDGLSNMLQDCEIGRILNLELTVEERMEHLVVGAKHAGGHDNISLVLVEVSMDMAEILSSPLHQEWVAS
jgi:serine/threonine protein phosphatase PrpC